MKSCSIIMLLLLVSHHSRNGPDSPSADSVVKKLYSQVVRRRPPGIPKGASKAAIWPLLSKGLTSRLDAAQSCENDYFRQHAGEDGKPDFGWLEKGLFSGGNERGIPAMASVERTEPQKDGSYLVLVRLTYKESFETYGRSPNPANTFSWDVAVVVKSEGGRFVVDDILFLKDNSTEVESRLADSFSGCDGSRWVGYKK